MDVSSTFQGLSLHDLSTDDESDEEPFKEETEPEHEDPELKKESSIQEWRKHICMV